MDLKRSSDAAAGGAPAKRAKETAQRTYPIPISLLSGFLGAGKTTMLRHILTNKEGMKVGVIVNDVAEINIDAKLIRNQDKGGVGTDYAVARSDMVELQNGCVCCSASDELFTNIDQLVQGGVSADGEPLFDHIVIECTGVAEPKMIRDKFQEMDKDGVALLEMVQLHTLVTVVDSSKFLDHWECKDQLESRPDLGQDEYQEGGGEREIVDLLVEQIECADVLVLNKTDQIADDKVPILDNVCMSLNSTATRYAVQHGKIVVRDILRCIGDGESMADHFGDDDHRRAVALAKKQNREKRQKAEKEAKEAQEAEAKKHDQAHGHAAAEGHGHGHAEAEAEEKKHGHGHGHGHDKEKKSEAHGHDHGHGHGGDDAKCEDADCKDASHDHAHGHGHGHGHGGKKKRLTHKEKYGISTFVYSRRRPFHPIKLSQIIKQLPVSVNQALGISDSKAEPQAQVDDLAGRPAEEVAAEHQAALSGLLALRALHKDACVVDPKLFAALREFEARHTALYADAEVLDDTAYGDCGASKLARAKMLGAQRYALEWARNCEAKEQFANCVKLMRSLGGIIRSKGFTWLATYHAAALYWSHAGSHFELKNIGSWWAAVSEEDMANVPAEQLANVRADFDGFFGDRRQEIIFIGVGIDEEVIASAMDECLLTDAELEEYKKHWLGKAASVGSNDAAQSGATSATATDSLIVSVPPVP